MLKSLLLTFQLFLASVVVAQFGWINAFGDTLPDLVSSSITDDYGNITVAGIYNGAVNFHPSQSGFLSSTENPNGYLAQYDSTGAVRWLNVWDGADGSNITSCTTDGINTYLLGYSNGQVDLDPGPGTLLTPAGTLTHFISKFDQNGNHIWSKTIQNINGTFAFRFIEYSAGNHLKLAGYFEGSFDANPGSGTHTLTLNNDFAVFFIDLDTDGNFHWARQLRASYGLGELNLTINGIATSSAGDLIATGFFNYNTDFDPGAGNTTTLSSGSKDFYLLKLTANGDFSWVKTSDYGAGNDVSVDQEDNLIVSGAFFTTFDFSLGNATEYRTPTDNYDGFILKTDPNGNYLWMKPFSGAGKQNPTCLSLTNTNSINCAGTFFDELAINDGTYAFSTTTTSESDVFYARLDPNGSFLSTLLIEGPGNSIVNAICTNAFGGEYITGRYSGTEDLNTNLEQTFFSAAGEVNFDAYIIRIGELDYTELSENKGSNLEIFPNPTSHQLHVRGISDASYCIFDFMGRALVTGTMVNHSIDVSTLAEGPYLLRIENQLLRFLKN